jgi:hypothetical protein
MYYVDDIVYYILDGEKYMCRILALVNNGFSPQLYHVEVYLEGEQGKHEERFSFDSGYSTTVDFSCWALCVMKDCYVPTK